MIIIKFLRLSQQLIRQEISLSFYCRKIMNAVWLRISEFIVNIKLFRKISRNLFPLDRVTIRREQKSLGVNKYNYVAEYKGQMVGKIGMHKSWKADHNIDVYVISGTYVSQRYRGLGIGEALHKVLLEDAKNDNLGIVYQTTLSTNKRNINLAKKFGFKRADKKFMNQVCGRTQDNEERLLAFYLDLKKTRTISGRGTEVDITGRS